MTYNRPHEYQYDGGPPDQLDRFLCACGLPKDFPLHIQKQISFIEAWNFLQNHNQFSIDGISYFNMCLDIDVVLVNPKTKRVHTDEKLNTQVEIWLECGPVSPAKQLVPPLASHDIRLDCGEKTFEQAIITLATLVKKYYE